MLQRAARSPNGAAAPCNQSEHLRERQARQRLSTREALSHGAEVPRALTAFILTPYTTYKTHRTGKGAGARGSNTRAQSAAFLRQEAATPFCRRKREAGLPSAGRGARAPPGGSGFVLRLRRLPRLRLAEAGCWWASGWPNWWTRIGFRPGSFEVLGKTEGEVFWPFPSPASRGSFCCGYSTSRPSRGRRASY